MSTRQSHEDTQAGSFRESAELPEADRAAAAWIARLTSGEATAEDFVDFERWRAADPANERALAQMRALWTELGPSLAARQPVASAAARVARGSARRGRRWGWWALAASAVLSTVLGVQLLSQQRYDMVTARGEQREQVLDDGSTMVMSGGTAVDVMLGDRRREIVLAHGEVYLDVSSDPERPFVVAAGAAEAEVLGTAFSVRRRAEQVQVLVRSGRVEVRAGDRQRVVEAGQRVDVRDGGLSDVLASDSDRELAWVQGRLIFEDAPLQEIVDTLARHHGGTVLIARGELRSRRYSAVIDLDRVDDWLAGLAQGEAMRVAGVGPLTVLY